MTQNLSLEEKRDLSQAFRFMVDAHDHQFRKNAAVPYACHPVDVLLRLRRWGVVDLVMWKATLCHDVLEERPDISRLNLTVCIGSAAADLVWDLTFLPDAKNPLPVSAQKLAYLKSFEQKSTQAIVIKMADRISNTEEFLQDDFDFGKKYWHKADGFFNNFFLRELEIIKVFGDHVLAAIRADFDKINEVFKLQHVDAP
jgi:(p)ppGpp synthase/HD superfamily hydrolase